MTAFADVLTVRIAEAIGVKPSEVRRIELRALRKLRVRLLAMQRDYESLAPETEARKGRAER